MRFDIVSDTHGYLSPELLDELEGADYIVHAGDICSEGDYRRLERIATVFMCLGNNDWAMAAMTHDALRLGYEGHGHQLHTFLAYNQNMRQLVFDKLKSAELVVFNRFDHAWDKLPYHKIVRVANSGLDRIRRMPVASL